jgi:hypothetical protein
MASMFPVPVLSYCMERRWLIEEFSHGVAAYVQAKASTDESEILAACKWKDDAKLALLKHQKEHGCV